MGHLLSQDSGAPMQVDWRSFSLSRPVSQSVNGELGDKLISKVPSASEILGLCVYRSDSRRCSGMSVSRDAHRPHPRPGMEGTLG